LPGRRRGRCGCSSSQHPTPDAQVAETIWQAVRDNQVLHIHYIDVGGVETERDVEPQHVVVGPNGSYLTAWCQLRGEERVFRIDRITRAETALAPRRAPWVVGELVVDGHETRLPVAALHPEDLLPNADIGLSRAGARVGAARRDGG
jgi:hypothetical protein